MVDMMFLHVKEAKYLHDYVIWLRFNDGAEGEIDLATELEGEVFGPLKDKQLFQKFRVDPDLHDLNQDIARLRALVARSETLLTAEEQRMAEIYAAMGPGTEMASVFRALKSPRRNG